MYAPLCGTRWILCVPGSPTGRPYPPRAPSKRKGLRCIGHCAGVAGSCAYLVVPVGVPIPQAAQAGPEGLGCIHRSVGVA